MRVRTLKDYGAMRIGVLTGGGDVPGLNSVIKSVNTRAIDRVGGTMLHAGVTGRMIAV